MKKQKNGKIAIFKTSLISALLALVMVFLGCSQGAVPPVTSPVTEPVTYPATDPVTQPVTQPITEPVTEPDVKLSLLEAALLSADNIKNIGVGVLSAGDETVYDYPYAEKIFEEGYEISHKNFSSETVIAKLLLDIDIPYKKDGYTYTALEFSYVTSSHNAIPRGTCELVKKTHSGIRMYMGYIITDDGAKQSVYTSGGEKIYEGASDSLIEALTRDINGNPLFYLARKGLGEYYYFDGSNKLSLSDHTSADDRGLYFDYNEDYGKSDNELNRYHKMELIETVVTEEVTVIVTEPVTEPVIEPVTEEITEPLTEPVTEPDTDEITDEITEEITEELIEETDESEDELLDETEKYTEELTEEATEETTESTEEITDEVTEEITEEITEPQTEIRYEVVDVIYTEELRYAFGYTPDWRLTKFRFTEMYNFKDGYGCVVYPDNTLMFLNVNMIGNRNVYREGYYWYKNGRLSFSYYASPVIRDERSLGNLYFDSGYVRMRVLYTDAYYGNDDFYVGEDDIIISEYGEILEIPEGYKIYAYSNGIVTLERNGRYGYYSTAGEWIAQPIYTYAKPFTEGLGVIGFSDGVKGAIDTDGNVVIPFKYTEVSQVSSGIIAVYSDESGTEFYAKLEKTAH